MQQVVILKNNGNNDVWGLKNIKELQRQGDRYEIILPPDRQ
jgi:hypothetical protein